MIFFQCLLPLITIAYSHPLFRFPWFQKTIEEKNQALEVKPSTIDPTSLLEPLNKNSDVPSSSDYYTSDLFERLKSNPRVDISKVAVGQHDGLNGLIASKDVNKDQIVLTIPLEESICSEDVINKCEICKKPEFQENLPSYNYVQKRYKFIYYLVEEYMKGKDSKWYDYLKSLPQDFSHLPENYNQAEKEFYKKIIGKEVKEDRTFQEFVNNVGMNVEKLAFLMDKVVQTRAFSRRGTCLIPVADMANHGQSSNVRVERSLYSSQYFTFEATKPIKAKEPIIFEYKSFYGPVEPLDSYGFVELRNSKFEVALSILGIASCTISRDSMDRLYYCWENLIYSRHEIGMYLQKSNHNKESLPFLLIMQSSVQKQIQDMENFHQTIPESIRNGNASENMKNIYSVFLVRVRMLQELKTAIEEMINNTTEPQNQVEEYRKVVNGLINRI